MKVVSPGLNFKRTEDCTFGLFIQKGVFGSYIIGRITKGKGKLDGQITAEYGPRKWEQSPLHVQKHNRGSRGIFLQETLSLCMKSLLVHSY